VPGYLSAVGGVSPIELERSGTRSVLVPSLLFVLSFSTIFVLLGVGATLIGSTFLTHRALLDKAAAALIIALGVGLYMSGGNRRGSVESRRQDASGGAREP
jgi:cytochrome c-type biogenesis protein